jgi:sensor histidine kinase YesM
VSIVTEIEYLNSYIDLQKLRFEEDVEIASNLQYDDSSTLTIEPMLLIPFVENAFKHGVTLVDKPFIHINLNIIDNALNFVVRNKFSREILSQDKNSGIGLSNVKARLELLYQGMFSLVIDSKNDIFSVNLSLKLK